MLPSQSRPANPSRQGIPQPQEKPSGSPKNRSIPAVLLAASALRADAFALLRSYCGTGPPGQKVELLRRREPRSSSSSGNWRGAPLRLRADASHAREPRAGQQCRVRVMCLVLVPQASQCRTAAKLRPLPRALCHFVKGSTRFRVVRRVCAWLRPARGAGDHDIQQCRKKRHPPPLTYGESGRSPGLPRRRLAACATTSSLHEAPLLPARSRQSHRRLRTD